MSGPELIAGGVPVEALNSHIGILGKTGSGKSYTARLMIEGLLERDRVICIVDPTGVHHGIRFAADGSVANSVVIFGGDHADVAISDAKGEQVARAIGKRDPFIQTAVIDLSMMNVSQRNRFFTDFADHLMVHNRMPLHLVIDEAHLFMPQGSVRNPKSAMMLHAANHLVSGGRVRGLSIMLISQRAAKIHKDALTQVETLIALRMIAPQDKNAVKAWLEHCGGGADIVGQLQRLPTGTGVVYAPELDYLETVAFPKIRTLDTMSPLRPDAPPFHPDVSLADVVGQLTGTLWHPEPSKPTAPASKRGGFTPPDRPADPEIATFRGQIRDLEATIDRQQAHIAALEDQLEQCRALSIRVRQSARETDEYAQQMLDLTARRPSEASPHGKPPPSGAPLRASEAPGPTPDDYARSPGASQGAIQAPHSENGKTDPLVEMARRVWPARLTWSQLCALCGRKARGGHFNRTRRDLLESGVVRMRESGRVELTDPPELGDLLPAAVLEQSLPEPAGKMFREIRAHGELTIEELAERLALAPRGGHWSNGIRMLRSNDLIRERPSGGLFVNPDLER